MGAFLPMLIFLEVKNVAIIIQLIISMILFFVLFYGISFILNMILKTTWLMVVVYPFIIILLMDGISTFSYLTNPTQSFRAAYEGIAGLDLPNILMLGSGFIGVILAGFTIRFFRNAGYKMF